MIKFEDVTSHSQGAKDRTAKTWQAKIGCVRLTVTRHIHYAADEWIAESQPDIINMVRLESKDIDDAKTEAVDLLRKRCMAIVTACK